MSKVNVKGIADVKFWPNRKWKDYWQQKRYRCKERGIPFELTRDECLALTESFPEDGWPSVKGIHLGRIDHSIGYRIDNVQWESYLWNVSKQGKYD